PANGRPEMRRSEFRGGAAAFCMAPSATRARDLRRDGFAPRRHWLKITAAALIALMSLTGHDFTALADDRGGATVDLETRAQGVPQGATQGATLAALEESLGIDALLEVIAREGHAYGEGLDQGMLSGKGSLRWQAVVARIYQPERLKTR